MPTRVIAAGILRETSYEAHLCPGANECGEVVEEACRIDHDAVLTQVGPLPPPKAFCHGLAVVVSAEALRSLPKDA